MKKFTNTYSNMEVDKFIKEKMDEIKANKKFCEHLASLGFDYASIEENISFITDYFYDYTKCENCNDINSCPLGDRYIKKVTYSDGILNFEYDICPKYKKINRVKNLSYICDIPEEYLTKSLGNIDKHLIRKKLLLSLVDIYQNNTNKFIFITSKKNSGGSFITSLFYKEIVAAHSVSGAYLDGSKRLNELCNLLFSNKAEFTKRMEELQNVEVLFINKISNYNFNEFTRNNVLYPLLETRASKGLTTVLTSELNFDDYISVLDVKNNMKDVRLRQIKELLNEFEKIDISLNIKVY